ESLEYGLEDDGIGALVRGSFQGFHGSKAVFLVLEVVNDAPHPQGGLLVVPDALVVGYLVPSPLQSCRLAEVGEWQPWKVEGGSVLEEQVQDELLCVDRQPRFLDRSVIGGAEPSHQPLVGLRLVAG